MSNENPKLSLFRGTAAEVLLQEVVDGQMVIATDTRQISFDVGNTRIAIPTGGESWDADATCTTAAGTAAKTANAAYYALRQNNRFTLRIQNANTSQSALTLNVNNTGAKPLYINGTASSSSNYTLPAGDYQAYYDGTNYYVVTDASIPGLSVSADVMTYSSTEPTGKSNGYMWIG